MKQCVLLLLLGASAPAAAHEGVAHTWWTLDPWVLAGFGMLLFLRPRVMWSFVAGVAGLFFALLWPLDALAEESLAAHMAQHMLLLAVAPPLLLAARPLAALAAALPPRWSHALYRLAKACRIPLAQSLSAATFANVAVIAGWHLPAALALALRSEAVHWLMHGSFLLAGLWLWTLLWQRLRDDAGGALAGTVAVVVVMMQMGFFGALLTFSGRVLYPVYAARAPQLGLDPLVDQQLAGLVMWVPSCLPYLAGALWLLARELRRPGGGQR